MSQGFGDPALFDAAMVVQQELGRLARPLPIVDVALAAHWAMATAGPCRA